jgi:hypothetical protein
VRVCPFGALSFNKHKNSFFKAQSVVQEPFSCLFLALAAWAVRRDVAGGAKKEMLKKTDPEHR